MPDTSRHRWFTPRSTGRAAGASAPSTTTTSTGPGTAGSGWADGSGTRTVTPTRPGGPLARGAGAGDPNANSSRNAASVRSSATCADVPSVASDSSAGAVPTGQAKPPWSSAPSSSIQNARARSRSATLTPTWLTATTAGSVTARNLLASGTAG